MKREPGIEFTGKLTVLSVSPHDEDQLSLHAIIGHSKWKMFTARNHSAWRRWQGQIRIRQTAATMIEVTK
jgi:hypothetical protein